MPIRSFFDPGGSGKGAVTWGGKLFMMVHWFFMTVVAASYTARWRETCYWRERVTWCEYVKNA